MSIHPFQYQAGTRIITFKMDLDIQFPADRWLIDAEMRRAPYEPDVTSILFRTIKQGDTVVDVGANVGYFTCMMAALVGPTGKVYSFEPGLNNLPKLDKNIALNEFKNVKVIEKPAWSKAGLTKQFYLSRDDSGGNAMWDPAKWWENKQSQLLGCEQVEVETTSLDIEIVDRSRLTLIKIDTEGAEYNVLKGAQELIETRDLHVIAEFSPFALEQLGQTEDSLRDFMKTCGYDTFLLYHSGDLPKLVPENTHIVFPHNINILFSHQWCVGKAWQEVTG